MDDALPLLIDTHCHLGDERLCQRLQAVLEKANEAGVVRYIAPGTHPNDWWRLRELAMQHPEIAPAYGLHPMYAELFSSNLLEQLHPFLDGAIAVGEIGLDYTLDIPREKQQQAFRQQLRLAFDRQLPVLLHCRKAFQDMLRILDEERTGMVSGVIHAYSGSWESAAQLIDRGLHLSLAGTVTFANAVRPIRVAREVPLDRLLLETDAPDLSPEPYRKQDNEPAYLIAIAGKIAAIRGITMAQVATITTENAFRLFKLSAI